MISTLNTAVSIYLSRCSVFSRDSNRGERNLDSFFVSYCSFIVVDRVQPTALRRNFVAEAAQVGAVSLWGLEGRPRGRFGTIPGSPDISEA